MAASLWVRVLPRALALRRARTRCRTSSALRLLVAAVVVLRLYLARRRARRADRAPSATSLSREVSLRLPAAPALRIQLAAATRGARRCDEIPRRRADQPVPRRRARAGRAVPAGARARATCSATTRPRSRAGPRRSSTGSGSRRCSSHRGHVAGRRRHPGPHLPLDRAREPAAARPAGAPRPRGARAGHRTRVPAGTPSAAGPWARTAGSCSTAATGWRSPCSTGSQTLGPDDYVVVEGTLPPNNTERLLSSGRTDDRRGVAFLARGLVAAEDRDRWRAGPDLVEHRGAGPGQPCRPAALARRAAPDRCSDADPVRTASRRRCGHASGVEDAREPRASSAIEAR